MNPSSVDTSPLHFQWTRSVTKKMIFLRLISSSKPQHIHPKFLPDSPQINEETRGGKRPHREAQKGPFHYHLYSIFNKQRCVNMAYYQNIFLVRWLLTIQRKRKLLVIWSREGECPLGKALNSLVKQPDWNLDTITSKKLTQMVWCYKPYWLLPGLYSKVIL